MRIRVYFRFAVFTRVYPPATHPRTRPRHAKHIQASVRARIPPPILPAHADHATMERTDDTVEFDLARWMVITDKCTIEWSMRVSRGSLGPTAEPALLGRRKGATRKKKASGWQTTLRQPVCVRR